MTDRSTYFAIVHMAASGVSVALCKCDLNTNFEGIDHVG
jgi:hypothetical protein